MEIICVLTKLFAIQPILYLKLWKCLAIIISKAGLKEIEMKGI